jgi:hypothetical protein
MQIPESVCYAPIKIGQIEGLFYGGRDIIYCQKEGILFVAQSKMNIADRVDSYFSNVSPL